MRVCDLEPFLGWETKNEVPPEKQKERKKENNNEISKWLRFNNIKAMWPPPQKKKRKRGKKHRLCSGDLKSMWNDCTELVIFCILKKFIKIIANNNSRFDVFWERHFDDDNWTKIKVAKWDSKEDEVKKRILNQGCKRIPKFSRKKTWLAGEQVGKVNNCDTSNHRQHLPGRGGVQEARSENTHTHQKTKNKKNNIKNKGNC